MNVKIIFWSLLCASNEGYRKIKGAETFRCDCCKRVVDLKTDCSAATQYCCIVLRVL